MMGGAPDRPRNGASLLRGYLLFIGLGLVFRGIVPSRRQTTSITSLVSLKPPTLMEESVQVVQLNLQQQSQQQQQQQQQAQGERKQIAQVKPQQQQLPSIIKSVELNECYVNANALTRNQTISDKKQNLPLFASIVHTPARIDNTESAGKSFWTAHFSLCHVTWNKSPPARTRIREWSDGTWYCDGEEAIVVDRGCPGGMGISIQCPQTDPDYTVSTISINDHTYHVASHVECERNHPLKKPAPSAKVVAAVMIYGMNLHEALEWIEYHRLLGVEHFFLYVMGDDDLRAWPRWPNLDYITYVPFDLNPDEGRDQVFLYQTAAQVDMIHRGRALGLDWIAYNDMDEYLVPRGGHTFRGYLDSRLQDDIPAIQVETVSFGNKDDTQDPQPLLVDYTWRNTITFGEKRTKCLVRPMHVNYYQIHWIASATPENPYLAKAEDELWIHHYKWPDKGVFDAENDPIVEDTSLRDRYSSMIGQKVRDMLRRIR